MFHVKTKRNDLHKAVKTVKRLVAKRLKVKRVEDPVFEETLLKRQCFGRFTFKGDALSIKKLFEEKGFTAVVGMAADQKRIRLTKTFIYKGKLCTALVCIYPDMQRLVILAKIEAQSV